MLTCSFSPDKIKRENIKLIIQKRFFVSVCSYIRHSTNKFHYPERVTVGSAISSAATYFQSKVAGISSYIGHCYCLNFEHWGLVISIRTVNEAPSHH